MSLEFKDLDEETRRLMLAEVDLDIENNRLYISPRLNENGEVLYPQLLKDAISKGSDETLAKTLLLNQCFKEREERRTKKGISLVTVPSNAHIMLAEGEFNRFYIRALCRRAQNDQAATLEVYRAKDVSNPRQESEAKIGQLVDPQTLLDDLRTRIGVDTVLGLPSGPNSGLSVRIKK